MTTPSNRPDRRASLIIEAFRVNDRLMRRRWHAGDPDLARAAIAASMERSGVYFPSDVMDLYVRAVVSGAEFDHTTP